MVIGLYPAEDNISRPDPNYANYLKHFKKITKQNKSNQCSDRSKVFLIRPKPAAEIYAGCAIAQYERKA